MRGERGQTSLLIVGLATVLLMAIAVVVDASAAFLQRQGLATVADGAALAGADAGARNLEALYGEGVGATPRLDQAEAVARAAVATYLRQTGAHADYPGLTYEVTVDGGRVMVQVRAPLELPLTLPGSPRTAQIGAEAAAVVSLD
jgi:uncharacterized membrane protein